MSNQQDHSGNVSGSGNGSNTSTTMNSNNNNITELIELCQQYVVAGWLHEEQCNEYIQFIQQYPKQIDYITHQIHSTISSLKQQQEKEQQDEQKVKDSTHSSNTGNINHHHHQNDHHHHVSWVDEQQQQEMNNENENNSNNNHMNHNKNTRNDNHHSKKQKIIYLPNEFYTEVLLPQQEREQTSSTTTPKTMQSQHVPSMKELFVEMCFYARLGYIQPPCCLHCTFTECQQQQLKSSNHISSNNGNYKKCIRYVIWRKDTNLVLHPDTIQSNIIILPCYIVRQLILLGSTNTNTNTNNNNMITIDGYQYDPIQKTIH